MTSSTARANAARRRVTGVAIATPHSGHVTTGFARSVASTFPALAQLGIRYSFCGNDNIGLIHIARNELAAAFLAHPEVYSHLLFIDSDIRFEPEDVLRILNHDVDVVAASYPMRVLGRGSVGKPAGRNAVNGLFAADLVGTGFLSIKRGVFLRLIEAFPESKITGSHTGRRDPVTERWSYNFFPSELINGIVETEDFGFCRLWRSIGGEIWIDPSIKVKHIGLHPFESDPLAAPAS